jgi:hypothetical protein
VTEHITLTGLLERDLVDDCHEVADRAGAFLAHVGQLNAKRSGTTVGYPDLTLICGGHVLLIEVKRGKAPGTRRGVLSKGQAEFIRRAAEQGVCVFEIDSLPGFVELLNWCRRHPLNVRRPA